MIYSEVPAGCDLFELPSLAARKGSARLKAVEAVIGAESARLAAQAAGPYLLEDEVCRKLRMMGLEIEGELPVLSPTRWELELPALPSEAEVVGIQLNSSERRQLLRFAPEAAENLERLLLVAERFFYEAPLKLIVCYTAPRFKPQ